MYIVQDMSLVHLLPYKCGKCNPSCMWASGLKCRNISEGTVNIKIETWVGGSPLTIKWYPPLTNEFFFGPPSPSVPPEHDVWSAITYMCDQYYNLPV